MRSIHFISGLPRSGSTLLANILAQNPEIHSTPTSACHDALFVMRNCWGDWIEHKAAISLGADENLQRVLSAILQSYHNTDRPVVIDKGRGWTSLLEMTEFALGRQAKVLVPVRSIAQIISSFEKLWRKRSATGKNAGDLMTNQTAEARAQFLLNSDQPVGLAFNRIKDALQRGFGDRMHFVECDDLTQRPLETMEGIYEFLELPAFEHDFNNVAQYTQEDDRVHGLDLHTIRQEVKPIKDDSVQVLGADLVRKLAGTEFWRK